MRVGTSESKRPSGRPSREIVVAEESCKCNAALRQGRIQSSFLGLKAHCRRAVERDEAEGQQQSPDVQVEGLRDETSNHRGKGALTESPHFRSV